MKKVLKNIVCGLAAANLIAIAVSCSDGLDSDDPFVGAGVITNSSGENNGNNGNNGGNNGNGGSVNSQYDVSGAEITFPVTVASTNNEDTVLLIKYDRSAAGANELISISNTVLKVWKNGTLVKTFDSIEFALDEYGASFSGGSTPISDENDRKEYKTKLSIGTTVAANDSVKVQLVSGTVGGAGKDAVSYGDIVVALIDKAASANYYTELCANSDEYKPLVNVPEANNSVNENPTPETPASETPSGEGPSGEAPATPSSTYKAYTLTTNKAVKKDDVGLTFQLFAGENEEPATVTLTNVKVSVKIGEGSAIEKTFQTVKIEHHTWDSNDKESNARVNLELGSADEEISSETTVVLQILEAVVSDSSKASGITFALQQDGKHNEYDMLTAATSKAFAAE